MAHVLIVEDEAPLRRILTLNLARRGCSVAEAESAATADEALRATPVPFDLLLLDLNLPDETGWDVLRRLKAERAVPRAERPEKRPMGRQEPRVIVITAVRPVRSRLEEFRPAAVLLKPFPIATLLRLIERVLAQAPAGMANQAAPPDLSPEVF